MATRTLKCRRCKGAVEARTENYKYDACGLPNVVLRGIEVRHCLECGEREAQIQALAALHKFLALQLANKHERLTPQEIRFLRKHLGLSGADFAAKLGVDRATVSRYESLESPQPMGKQTERFLRLMVMVEKPVTSYPLEETAIEEPNPAARITVEMHHSAWSPAA